MFRVSLNLLQDLPCTNLWFILFSVSILSVGVPSPPENPYNGTNFTVIGEIELDPSVDTDVTVTGTWSGGNTPQETSVPPYRILLPFLPATTNSSGEYTLTISVRPTDNSPLITSNSHNASYNLVIKRKLMLHMLIILMIHCVFKHL